MCYLKNAELEAKHQKYKGRVVLWGDIDDSGSYAVFTEQGSSASQMTAAKIMDIISRLPQCAGQATDAVSAYTQVRMEDASKLLRIPQTECPDVWIRLPRHTWPRSWFSIEDPVVPLERNLYGHLLAGLFLERQFEKIQLQHCWEKVFNWECLFVHRQKGLFLSEYVDDIKLAGKTKIDPMWKVLNKEVDLGEPTSFLDHVYLDCTRRQCEISKDILDNYRTMFESRISAGEVEKLPFPQNLRISSWSYDMEGHAKKCVERYCELAKRTTQQLYKVSTPCIDDHHFKEEEMKSVGEMSALKLFWNARTWHELEGLIFYGQWINMHDLWQNGPKLVTNAWIDWFHTFITHVNTNADWDCFKTPFLREFLNSKSTSGGTLCVFRK